MFILHERPKLMGGTTAWEQVAQYGLPFLPVGIISTEFGLAAALTELGGGHFCIGSKA
ncbi:hypothetical protein QEH59_01430 [Coraliomargarita sp. SDUM461004]|uniref:Uncharacterized protein n=1 Tax=Thalassobacterium sedimentorum TaxID=3041258 RepID=A0ABU1AFZ4_9BACT|nr:hypothetical protein [Coraliomargarita sp. SDUM461004]MDQ8193068.1 hypothetical protein [Coraliomargarita sp. SDUM461004]